MMMKIDYADDSPVLMVLVKDRLQISDGGATTLDGEVFFIFDLRWTDVMCSAGSLRIGSPGEPSNHPSTDSF